MYKIGMIHGRYQPFHLGHFKYLKDALMCSEKLIIGITNPDPNLTGKDNSDAHRHQADANPFTYFLRLKMIQKSILMDTEIAHRIADITFVPFPINKPDFWYCYLPPENPVQIMNLIDPWDHVKKEMFERHDFKVFVIGSNRYQTKDDKYVSGTSVRSDINTKGEWQSKVPPGTRYVLENWLAGKSDLII